VKKIRLLSTHALYICLLLRWRKCVCISPIWYGWRWATPSQNPCPYLAQTCQMQPSYTIPVTYPLFFHHPRHFSFTNICETPISRPAPRGGKEEEEEAKPPLKKPAVLPLNSQRNPRRTQTAGQRQPGHATRTEPPLFLPRRPARQPQPQPHPYPHLRRHNPLHIAWFHTPPAQRIARTRTANWGPVRPHRSSVLPVRGDKAGGRAGRRGRRRATRAGTMDAGGRAWPSRSRSLPSRRPPRTASERRPPGLC
jgi:hypothetical protein